MRRNDRVARLHRLALETDPFAPTKHGVYHRFVAGSLFFLVALRQICRYQARWGRFVRESYGVSHFRQWCDLWHCMWSHNQLARHYYWRKLFLLPNREAWLDNFEHRQVNAMLDALNLHVPAKRIANKILFHEHCLAHGLPTPPILAAWEEGESRVTERRDDPRCDVFAKPSADYGSVGATPIPFDPRSGTYRYTGKTVTWQPLLAELAATMGRSSGCLIQPRLRNSPDAAVYGNDDVCNLRIVTGRLRHGRPIAIASVMRIPSSFTTQGHDRNVLLASVDVTNGRLGMGLFRDITLPQFSHHPDTGHAIEHRLLPRWSEMLELVLRAHETCPWMPFVGWDVVDSDHGLMLLEANAYWGGDSAQLPGAPALGETRFPEIYLDWFEHLRAERGSIGSGDERLAERFEAAEYPP